MTEAAVEIAATPAVVTRISATLPDDFATLPAEQQVSTILAGFNAVRAGDPLGRVCRNPTTGEIAHRVDEDGLHRWRVSPPDAPFYRIDEPTLPKWDVLYEGETA